MLKIPRSINLMLPLLLCSAGMHAAVFSAPDNKMSTMQQNTTCSGLVKDALGDAVIGASVIIKGTTEGTITDVDGKFSLAQAKKGDVLVISYVGYSSQEIVWDVDSNRKVYHYNN